MNEPTNQQPEFNEKSTQKEMLQTLIREQQNNSGNIKDLQSNIIKAINKERDVREKRHKRTLWHRTVQIFLIVLILAMTDNGEEIINSLLEHIS